jgi:PPM family protein phosphatase
MSLRIVDKFWASDVGRQRQNNEDNYFARPPLFAVADGMGGAQAGEVASAETVNIFKQGMPDLPPAEALVEIIQKANKRVFDMSRESTERQGMGCTCTSAYLDGDDLVVAHVGDSRAYLFRDGDLIRLTRDHSLVGDLVALGKITEEEAEHHPQRSVITRALGPEATVQVDVEVYPARAGDLYLLCSDGLTSMVSEEKLRPLLEDFDSLDQLGRRLIKAANDAGGRDNITVILFSLGEQSAVAAAGGDAEADTQVEGETGEYATFAGDAVGQPRQGVSRPTTAQVADAVRVADAQEEEYRRSGTVALQAIPKPQPETREDRELPQTGPPPIRKRKRRLPVGWIVGVLIALGMIVLGGWVATRAVYFIGTADDERTVAVFRGLPYELPFGVDLYSTEYTSGATIDQVPERRRGAFLDHKLRSLNDAKDLVLRLERGEISQ